MADHEITAKFEVKSGAGVGARPSYAELVAAEDAALGARLQQLAEVDREAVARMVEDARRYGTGVTVVTRDDDGNATVKHVPLSEITHEQLAEGERQAQETVIHANLDQNCSCLDADQSRRGKVSRLDGQGTVGDVSELDR